LTSRLVLAAAVVALLSGSLIREAMEANAANLLQFTGDLFGVLLMPLKDFKAGSQQAFEFGITGGRNERRLKRAIHGLVIRNLIGNIVLVESRALEPRQFRSFVRRCLR
jgi:hypothetical protein